MKTPARVIVSSPLVGYAALEAACRGILAGTVRRRQGAGTSSKDNPRSQSWDDNIGLQGAADFLARGWEEGIAEATAGLDVLAPDMGRGGWDVDVCGEYVAAEAYAIGDPECMYRKEAGEAPKRVRVIVNPSLMCNIDAAVGIAYARAVCAYVAGLIQAGYDVAVTALYAAAVHDGRTGAAVIPVAVKEFSQEPDASRLAFMTHPAFCRRVMFAYAEVCPDVHLDLGRGGYGYLLTPDLSEDEVKFILREHYADERLLILPPINQASWRNPDQWTALFLTLAVETTDDAATGLNLDSEED